MFRCGLTCVALGLATLSSAGPPLARPPQPGDGVGTVTLSGRLRPVARRWVFSPATSRVERFAVKPGDKVAEGQPLVLLFDADLEHKLKQLREEIEAAEKKIEALTGQLERATPAERPLLAAAKEREAALRRARQAEHDAWIQATGAEADRPGFFWVKAPAVPGKPAGDPTARWTVLGRGFQAKRVNRVVRPSDRLLRLAVTDGPWEVEVRLPAKQVGRVLAAFDPQKPGAERDVDLLLPGAPQRTFRGQLARSDLAREAVRPEGQGKPFVVARVRVDGDDLPEQQRIPRELRWSGAEMRCTVRCGPPAGPERLGKPVPGDAAEIRLQRSGVLMRLQVREGERVTKGQVLAAFGDPVLDDQLRKTEAELRIRQFLLRKLRRQLAEATDPQERSRLGAEVMKATAKRDALAAQGELVRRAKAELTLKAPRDGIVGGLPWSEGIGKFWDRGERVPFCTIAAAPREPRERVCGPAPWPVAGPVRGLYPCDCSPIF